MRFLFLFISFFLLNCTCLIQATERIQLSGIWRFQLDPMGFGKTPGSELYLSKLTETIVLPGSTDEGGKGIQNFVSHVDRLSRKFEYCGQAWYQREVIIPESWKGKEIILNLERCHWETAVYVDGKPIATKERLSTPNRFNLTEQLTPGIHTLTLCVDNRLKYPMEQWNHGTTEYTQTNWNGIVGDLSLQVMNPNYISNVKIYTDIENKKVTAKIYFAPSKSSVKGDLLLEIKEKEGKTIVSKPVKIALSDSVFQIEETLDINRPIKLWDEFNPSLYTLDIQWSTPYGEENKSEQFGFRKIEQGKHHIRLNNHDIHLRGVLDCAVFPLTGYPATDTDSWEKIFRTIKEYGMNHVRFHSWCPPQAAFHAADRLGLYLQVELPMWIKDVGKYPARRQFFEEEMYAILNEYGNHPSFILKCNGNENEGNFDVLEDLIIKGQQYDNRHLYSASTARTHVKADQFYVSHLTHKGWITVYEGKPSTDWDRNAESDIDVPVIAHETGQRCMYPNFAEISKYTGVLEARNFNVYRERLARNGMLHQADDFFRATGAHTVLQYKEVNESLLRTSKSGGFQLLGLSDFPGQGSAFVGILDAFWEDKGLVSPEKFRESCAPTVLLARMPKRVYNENETFTAQLGIYHFGNKDIKRGKVNWALTDEAGRELKKGNLSHQAIQSYTVTDSLAKIDIPLEDIKSAGKYTLHVALGACHNEWDIWVYPSKTEANEEHLSFTESWETARKMLSEGKQVLFVPQSAQGRKTQFASHFWNPIMFNWDPMIVGTLIEHTHPSMADFPTSYYADWQWWDILNYGTAIDLTALSSVTPIIQSIDTYEENRKLGIAFEVKSGKGKLFVLCADIHKDIDKRPAMKQLMYSIKNYVGSDRFQPQNEVPTYMLDALFDTHVQKKKKDNSSDAINQLLNK